jgi:hypothetical protein
VRLTLLCSKVTVTSSNVFKLASCRVPYLHIASKVLVAVDFGEVAKRLVGDFCNIKFVVSNGQQVVIKVFEDGIRDVSIWSRCIAESSTIM